MCRSTFIQESANVKQLPLVNTLTYVVKTAPRPFRAKQSDIRRSKVAEYQNIYG